MTRNEWQVSSKETHVLTSVPHTGSAQSMGEIRLVDVDVITAGNDLLLFSLKDGNYWERESRDD